MKDFKLTFLFIFVTYHAFNDAYLHLSALI